MIGNATIPAYPAEFESTDIDIYEEETFSSGNDGEITISDTVDAVKSNSPGEFMDDITEESENENHLESMNHEESDISEKETEEKIDETILSDVDTTEDIMDGSEPMYTAADNKCGDNLTWSLSGGNLTITGTGDMYEYSYDETGDYLYDEDDFPWSDFREEIKMITVGDGVTTISDAAFWNCENLTEVRIGRKVGVIGSQAFFWDTSLKQVTFAAYENKDDPNNSTTLIIGDNAFDGCESLSSIKLPDITVSLGEGAFDNCINLETVELGAALTTIGKNAFSCCEKLRYLELASAVDQIGDYAFDTCAEYEGDPLVLHFKGDLPALGMNPFNESYIMIEYPVVNKTYTDSIKNNKYGAVQINWMPYGQELKKIENVMLTGNAYTLYLSWDRTDFGEYEDGGNMACGHGYHIEWSAFDNFPEDATGTMDLLPSDVDVKNQTTGEEYCEFQIVGLEPKVKYYVRAAAYAIPDEKDIQGPYSDIAEYTLGESFMRWQYQADSLYADEDLFLAYEKLFNSTNLPCYTIVNKALDNNLGYYTLAWESLKEHMDTIENLPEGLRDQDFKNEYVYEAALFALLECRTNDSDHGQIMQWSKVGSEVYEQVKDLLIKYKRYNYGNCELFWELSEENRKRIFKEIDDGFASAFGIDSIFNGLDVITKIDEDVTSLQEICNLASNYGQLTMMSENLKAIVKEMYDNCPDDNRDLKKALENMCAHIDENEREAQEAIFKEKAMRYSTLSAAGFFWEKMREKMELSIPFLAFWWEVCNAAEYVSGTFLNADDISAKYMEIKAVVEIEALLRQVYITNKNTYFADKNEKTAQRYLETGDLLLYLYAMDCRYAVNFVNECDDTKLKVIKDWVVSAIPNTDKEAIKKRKELSNTIIGQRNIYLNRRYNYMTFWIPYLEKYYPDEYEDYKYLIDEEYIKESVCDHSWKSTGTIAATCSKDGSKTYTCTICGKKKSEIISKTDIHKWSKWKVIKQATSSQTGVEQRQCTVCGLTDKRNIKKITSNVQVENILPKMSKVTIESGIYTVSRDSEVTFAAPTKKTGNVVIPDNITVKGVQYKVTAIKANAFKNNKKVTSVTIGKNVLKIGNQAFSGCTKLSSVKGMKKVSSIGTKAFYKCSKIKKIVIPSKVNKIGKSAFQGCRSLKNINIKTSKLTKKKVGNKAFKGVPKTAKVKVPKRVKKAYKKWLPKKGIAKKMIH